MVLRLGVVPCPEQKSTKKRFFGRRGGNLVLSISILRLGNKLLLVACVFN